jgi:cellulose synthase/poly-beta-1,6-N-acetylglucosamine synthase-like glycosyltransferase
LRDQAVAKRVIAAACKISWPRDRFEVQVLDDSNDQETKRYVDKVNSPQVRVGESVVGRCGYGWSSLAAAGTCGVI